jgi:trigger factor
MPVPQTESTTKREIQVEIPAEEVARETDKVVQNMQRVARLPGFRRGKVPPNVIRNRFAEEIKTEVVDHLIPRFFRQEAERQKLVPVSQPRVSDLHLHEGEPLRFKASFEVLPEIELSGYHDLRVEKPDIAISDEEVEASLSRVREQHATFTAVEGRPLADGDYAQVSFTGTPKRSAGGAEDAPGAPHEKPAQVDDVMVEVGGADTMREFSDNLRGVSPGETRSFEVSYPADFNDQRLAGKTFDYTVTIKAIKQKQLPELNDDFAKEIGQFNSIDEVRRQIREGMEHEKKHAADREAKEKLIDELIKRHDFEVPEALVERQVDVRLERGLRALAAQGMRAEDMKKMDFNRLRAGQREAATREVKASLLLDRIAETEKIQVSDEEIDREIQALAEQSQQSVESIRARLTGEGALDRIRNRIRTDKALDFLYQRSA